MQREMFVRMATAVLGRFGDAAAAEKAEAIAFQMDMFASVLGEVQAAVPPPPAPPPAFPAPPSAAVHPAISTAELEESPALLQQSPLPPVPSLIITDTRMPVPTERVRAAAAQAQIEKPGVGGMKVEDLSRLVQERTPERITLEVQGEDGFTRRAVWTRNVISRHAFGAVNLIYYPMNASASVRELSEVTEAIAIEELPVDLTAIVAKLRAAAIQSITPRGPIMSMTPPTGAKPVGHPADGYKDPSMTSTVSGVFDNSVGVAPPDGSPRYRPIY